jgi:hypothetical protein
VDQSLHAPIISFFSSVVERGIAAMQVILRSLFRSREGAVLLLFVRNAASSSPVDQCPRETTRSCSFLSERAFYR